MEQEIVPIDEVEQSFLANIERGESALAAAETDYERLEVRDAARAAQVVTAALGRRNLVKRFSVLVSRAERAIAKANPPDNRGGRGNRITDDTVSRTDLSRMRQAHDHITDEQFEEIVAESEEPMTRQQLIKLGQEKRKEEERAKKEAEREQAKADAEAVIRQQQEIDDLPIHRVDIVGLNHYIEAASVDAIITDPPYEKEFLSCWNKLAEFAAHALKPGCPLIVMTGQTLFAEVWERLKHPELSYRWTIAYLLPQGGLTFHRPFGVTTSWKPCLVYTRKGADIPDGYPTDVVNAESGRNANDKQLHEWGQNEAGIGQIILKWVPAGGTVCDPFCGAGSTLVAATKLGHPVTGGDIDAGNVYITKQEVHRAKND